jgi:hypothetical protein
MWRHAEGVDLWRAWLGSCWVLGDAALNPQKVAGQCVQNGEAVADPLPAASAAGCNPFVLLQAQASLC